MIFYWFVHHIEGDNGQDIRHTLILGFSLLFRLLSFGYACPLCVLAKGETLLHRACKRNQVETVFKILALPGTDVNVQGKVFLALCPVSFRNVCCATTVSVHYPSSLWGSQERLTSEDNSGEEIGKCGACVPTGFNLQLKCKGCVSKERKRVWQFTFLASL